MKLCKICCTGTRFFFFESVSENSYLKLNCNQHETGKQNMYSSEIIKKNKTNNTILNELNHLEMTSVL